jgi:dephospho-CoA kinase
MAQSAHRFVVGLTGGIGSGKTAVSDAMCRLGADIIDTDRIAHQLTGPHGAAVDSVVAAFGPEARTAEGAMNRDYIRRRVFEQPLERQRLEAILHPLIREEAQRQLQQAEGCYSVLVIPLLVEKQGWQSLLDATLVVDCDPDLQVQRVQTRSGLEKNQIFQIMKAQANRQDRLKMASHVIENNGDYASLLSKVEDLHKTFHDLAQRKRLQASSY